MKLPLLRPLSLVTSVRLGLGWMSQGRSYIGPNRAEIEILAVAKRPQCHKTSAAHHKKPAVLHAHINHLNT